MGDSTGQLSVAGGACIVRSLQVSFGTGYADTPQGRSRFRGNAIEAFRRVVVVYPQLRIDIQDRGIVLLPSATHVPKIPG